MKVGKLLFLHSYIIIVELKLNFAVYVLINLRNCLFAILMFLFFSSQHKNYPGEFKNGYRHGYGITTYPEGKVYKGITYYFLLFVFTCKRGCP